MLFGNALLHCFPIHAASVKLSFAASASHAAHQSAGWIVSRRSLGIVSSRAFLAILRTFVSHPLQSQRRGC